MWPPGSVLKILMPLLRVGYLHLQSRPVLAAMAYSKWCGGSFETRVPGLEALFLWKRQ